MRDYTPITYISNITYKPREPKIIKTMVRLLKNAKSQGE